MQVTKEEFLQWKENQVTNEVFKLIEDRITEAKEVLATTAGEDQRVDSILVGMIRAFSELKEISYDEH